MKVVAYASGPLFTDDWRSECVVKLTRNEQSDYGFTAALVTLADAEAAVKQARIDALEEAAGVCDKQVDTCLAALSMGGTVLDKQFQKASFLLSEHLARRVRSLKGNTP